MSRDRVVLHGVMLAVVAALVTLALAPTLSAAPPPPPTISGADGDVWRSAPVYTIVGENRLSLIEWTASNGQSGRDFGRARVRLGDPVVEGKGELVATQTSVFENAGVLQRAETSAPSTRTFVVDRTPPGPLAVTGPSGAVAGATVPFSWSGAEAGATFTWRVDGPGGPVQGPYATAQAAVATGPFAPGGYAFVVRQVDAAGNRGPDVSAALTVTAAPPPAAPAPAPAPRPIVVVNATPKPVVLRLPTRNAGRLSPRKSAQLRGIRPLLGWTRGPQRADLYNLQVFRVAGIRTAKSSAPDTPRLVKVASAFPRTERYRMPPGKLARGQCYVWRVWPYVDDRFTRTPLGVSHFCVAEPSGGAPAEAVQ